MNMAKSLLAFVLCSLVTSLVFANDYTKNDFVYAKLWTTCKSAEQSSSLKLSVYMSVYNLPEGPISTVPSVIAMDNSDSGWFSLLQVQCSMSSMMTAECVSFKVDGYEPSKLVLKPSTNPNSPESDNAPGVRKIFLDGTWYQQAGQNPLQMRCEILVPTVSP